jgi:hypothetical protein
MTGGRVMPATQLRKCTVCDVLLPPSEFPSTSPDALVCLSCQRKSASTPEEDAALHSSDDGCFSGILLLIGALLLCVSLPKVVESFVLESCGQKVEGRIDFETQVTARLGHTYVDYTYMEISGQLHRGSDRLTSGLPEPFEVLYLPLDPSISKVAGNWRLLYWALLCMGGVMLFSSPRLKQGASGATHRANDEWDAG